MGRKRKFTDEQEQEIARRYAEGENTTQLGKAYGVGSSTICRLVKRQGLATRFVSAAIPDAQQADVVTRYLEGENTVQLGRAYGLHPSTISNILRRQGVATRSLSEAQGGIPVAQHAEVVRRYLEGESTTQLGKSYGVSSGTIVRVIRRRGVATRSISEAKGGIPAVQYAEVIRRYLEGENTYQLGMVFGLSARTIGYILKRQGIPIRSRSLQGRFETVSRDLIELVESLGEHVTELPQKAWLAILRQSKALNSIGTRSMLHPLKISLLQGDIPPEALVRRAPEAEAAETNSTPADQFAELLAKQVEALGIDLDSDDDTDDAPAVVALPSLSDAAEDDDERRLSLINLASQRILDGVSATCRAVGGDEETVRYLLAEATERHWSKALTAADPAAVVAEVRASVPTTPWAEEVRSRFLSDWRLIEELGEIPGFHPPAGFELNLMQRREAALLLRDKARLNISQTGAGKTLASLIGVHAAGCRRVLVIAPNNALASWSAPLATMFPRTSFAVKTFSPAFEAGDQPRAVILNHEAFSAPRLAQLAGLLAGFTPDAVVIDEIHGFKAREGTEESQRRRALKLLLDNLRPTAKVIYGLSATPVINELGEAIGLMELVSPETAKGLDSAHTPENCLRVHERLQGISTRYLPPAPCKVSQHIREANADTLLDDVLAAGLQSPHAVEAALIPAKLPLLLNECRRGEKTVVFTSVVEGVVAPTRAALEAAGLTVVVHTGLEKETEGRLSVEAFISDPTVDVLLASTGTLAVGFDGLQTVCRKQVFLTLPWTAAELEQSIGRIRRQGTVFEEIEVVTLTAWLTNPETGDRWSLDEQKIERLHSKRSISAAVTDGITPDRASLELTPTAIQRALAKWAVRLHKTRQEQQDQAA